MILAGSKLSSEDFGGSGVVSLLVSGDEVGGRWEESGTKPDGRDDGEVMPVVETVLSEEEGVSRSETVDSLWLIC